MIGIYVLPDFKGTPLYGIHQSDYIDMVKLNPTESRTITIPTGAMWAVFNATGNFLCRFDAACPADADIADGSAGELNPVLRRLKKQDSSLYATINLYAIQKCVIMIAYYSDKIPNR